MRTQFSNEEKTKIFHDYLGGRFNTFEIASENAPISFLAIDPENKEYYIHVEIAKERSVLEREHTGIKIENTHFYHLYSLISQGSNVFWFEAFENGYFLFYLNDCCTPEQLNVTEEFTLIGVASALHVEKPQAVTKTEDGTGYYVAAPPSQPTEIVGSLNLPKAKVIKRKR
jgi:hypothetical protein